MTGQLSQAGITLIPLTEIEFCTFITCILCVFSHRMSVQRVYLIQCSKDNACSVIFRSGHMQYSSHTRVGKKKKQYFDGIYVIWNNSFQWKKTVCFDCNRCFLYKASWIDISQALYQDALVDYIMLYSFPRSIFTRLLQLTFSNRLR